MPDSLPIQEERAMNRESKPRPREVAAAPSGGAGAFPGSAASLGAQYLPMFLAEARDQLGRLDGAVIRLELDPDTVDEVFRIVHSLKGMCATMGFAAMAALTHEMEDVLELVRRRRSGAPRDTVDIVLACLDALAGAVSSIEAHGEERLDPTELTNRLRRLVRSGDDRAWHATPAADAAASPLAGDSSHTIGLDARILERLAEVVDELESRQRVVTALTAELDVPGLPQAIAELTRCSESARALIAEMRWAPIATVLSPIPRLVRDLCASLGKQARLTVRGGDVHLDREILQALGGALGHLVRNAIDHGIEPASERSAAGKRPVGEVEIAAHRSGREVVVEVADDGRGIDHRAVAQLAASRGLVDPTETAGIDAAQAAHLLLHPGFSGTDTVSATSGRGVGLDAVRAAVEALGGQVEIESQAGAGTRVRLRLPQRDC